MFQKTEVNLMTLLFLAMAAGVGTYHVAQISGVLNVIIKEADAAQYDTSTNSYLPQAKRR